MQPVGPRRVVEHGGNSSTGGEREQQGHCRRRARRQYADDFVRVRKTGERALQAERRPQQRSVGFLVQPDVLDQFVMRTKRGHSVKEGVVDGAFGA
ncbi:hypothetical protein SDC9_188559 [bioreactor metagenome]|uniref:Uncharacterized protein n=1 Tax=bioreactor metagenome TaxID=1076179 RepID=A0A645HS29_9ZZZZ